MPSWAPEAFQSGLVLGAFLGLILYNSAVLAEIMRAGILSLPKGQGEAASAMGMTRVQALRYVILPQGLRRMVPATVSQLITLNKDTTLVSIISMFDPIRIASTIRATTDWGGIYWELYAFIALVFFVFCFAMSRYSVWLERQLERDHRR